MIPLARLFFPLPLLIVGVIGIDAPWMVAIAVVLAAMPMLLPKIMLGRRVGKFYFTGAVVLFVLGALIGTFVSYNPLESLPMLFTILGSIALLFVISNPTLPLRTIAAMLAITGALVAAYFSTQYVHFQYSLENGAIAHFARQLSAIFPAFVFYTPHPNAVATYLESTLFITLGLTQTEKTGWRWIWWAIITLMAYALFVSDSRGAMISITIASGLWITLRFPRVWQSPVGVMGGTAFGVVVLAFVIAIFTNNATLSPIVARAVHGFGGRYTLYANSLQLLRDYPFTGLGLGNAFAMVYSRYQLLIDVPFLYYAHNMPLAVWLGQGLLGLIGFLWLVIAFYRSIYLAERRSKYIPHQALFRGSWLGVTATLIHGLFDAAQFSPDRWTMPLLFALMGISAVLIRRTLRAHPPRQSRSKLRLWVWLTVFAILLPSTIFAPKILAQWQVNVGALYQTYGELASGESVVSRDAKIQRARQTFESVLKWQPENSVANRRLGMMALDNENYDLAIAYLETAYRFEPHNQPTIKALGYAYLWHGAFDNAEKLFQQVEFKVELVNELRYYHWYWGTLQRDDLSKMALKMAEALQK